MRTRHVVLCLAMLAVLLGAAPRTVEVPAAASAVDPERYAVASGDYTVTGLRTEGFPARVPVTGHYVVPEGADGPRPFALFLHGKHTTCYRSSDGAEFSSWPCPKTADPIPSHLGYRYLQRSSRPPRLRHRLGDGQRRRRPGGPLCHRRRCRGAIGAGPTPPAAVGGLDGGGDPGPGRHRLVRPGRPRPDAARRPQPGRRGRRTRRRGHSPSDAWRIRGLVLLAPADNTRQVAPRVPTTVLMGYCDGDLNFWPGQGYLDVARDLCPTRRCEARCRSPAPTTPTSTPSGHLPRQHACGRRRSQLLRRGHPLCGARPPDPAQRGGAAGDDRSTHRGRRGVRRRRHHPARLFDGRLVRPAHAGGTCQSARSAATGCWSDGQASTRPSPARRVRTARSCGGTRDDAGPRAAAGHVGADAALAVELHPRATPTARPRRFAGLTAGHGRVWSRGHRRPRLVDHLDARVVVDPEAGPVRLAFGSPTWTATP